MFWPKKPKIDDNLHKRTASRRLILAIKSTIIRPNEQGALIGFEDARNFINKVKYDSLYDLKTLQEYLDTIPVTLGTPNLTEDEVLELIANHIS